MTALRPEETIADGARRVAIDAVYEARDKNGTMHDAGQLASERVLGLLSAGGDSMIAVATERARQLEIYDLEHDDVHTAASELARAAECELRAALHGLNDRPLDWPFPDGWVADRSPEDRMTVAAAFIAAEIDRRARLVS